MGPLDPGFTPQRRLAISSGHSAHSDWKQLLAGWRICLTCMTEVSGLRGLRNSSALGSSRLQKHPLNHKRTVITASHFIFVQLCPAPSIHWSTLKPPPFHLLHLCPLLSVSVAPGKPLIHPRLITPKGEMSRGPDENLSHVYAVHPWMASPYIVSQF